MAQDSPIIQDGILTYQLDGSPVQIAVDSADWYACRESGTTVALSPPTRRRLPHNRCAMYLCHGRKVIDAWVSQ
jgi:hypothetical protein